MPFRFNAAASAKRAKGLARQASRRLSLLAYTGDMSAPLAERGGGLGRPSPAPASSAAAAARARTMGLRRIGRDAAVAAAPPPLVGRARRFTSPAAAPPTAATAAIDFYLLFILVFALNLFIARYLLRFAKILNSLSPAEIEQLRHTPAVWSSRSRRHDQTFQAL
eukprot:g11850.t1